MTAHVDELDWHGGKTSRMMRNTVELRGHDVALRDTAVLNGLTLFDSIVGSCRAFLPSNQFVQSGANRLIVFSLRFVKKPQHGKNGARKYDVKIYSSLLHPRDQGAHEACGRGQSCDTSHGKTSTSIS